MCISVLWLKRLSQNLGWMELSNYLESFFQAKSVFFTAYSLLNKEIARELN